MIRAHKIMNPDFAIISPQASLSRAAQLLQQKKEKVLLVGDKDNPLAILTEEDVLRSVLLRHKHPEKTKVKEIMQKNYHVVQESSPFHDIEALFKENPKSRIVVLTDKIAQGVITESDMISAYRDFTKMHYVMQEILLAIFGIFTAIFLFYFSPLGQSLLR